MKENYVYCKQCRFIHDGYDCDHPKNVTVEDTAMERTHSRGICHIVNKSNNCPYFEPQQSTIEHLWKTTCSSDRHGIIAISCVVLVILIIIIFTKGCS